MVTILFKTVGEGFVNYIRKISENTMSKSRILDEKLRKQFKCYKNITKIFKKRLT